MRLIPLNHLAWAVTALSLLAACEQQPQTLRFTGATMGTTYSVTIARAPAELDTEQAQTRVENILEKVNAQMSTYREDSELSRINKGTANQWIPVSTELLALLKSASDLDSLTQGAFDVTVGPLVNLWGFGPEATRDDLPDNALIKQRMQLLGLDKLIFRDTPPSVNKRLAGVYVDLSAIAKGYGVDQVAAELAKLGAHDFLVEIGGELYGQGNNPDGHAWRIAVEQPNTQKRGIELIVNLQDIGMATSGDYRNYFEVDGKRYSHTIDPRTGRPVTHDLRAVTVLAPSAANADALATALLVMGPTAGLKFAEREKIAALFISGANDAYNDIMTAKFRSHVSTGQ